MLPAGLEEGQQEQREGITLHSGDKQFQVSPIATVYLKAAVLSLKSCLVPKIISLLEIITSFQIFKTFGKKNKMKQNLWGS